MGNFGDSNNYVKWFSELSKNDVNSVGIKGANIAVMYNSKLPVPPGFIITKDVFDTFLSANGLNDSIRNILRASDFSNISSLERNSAKIKHLINDALFPEEIGTEIINAYEILDVDKGKISAAMGGALDILRTSHEPPFVAVRSSPISKKNDKASFSAQHDSLLNVKGHDALLKTIKKLFGSYYNSRAIYYRQKHGIQDEDASLAIVVQKMIDSDKSGNIFSKNPLRDDGTIYLEGVFGLGTGLVRGRISPDSYIMNSNLELVDEKISDKRMAYVRDSSGKTGVVKLEDEISKREVLNGHEIKMLAQYSKRLEEIFGVPQDVEFAISQGEINLLQSRPITTKAKFNESEFGGNVVLSGKGVSPGIQSGIVKVIVNKEDLDKVQKGNVLVIENFDLDAMHALYSASAVVVESGGVTSALANIARELEIPVVICKEKVLEKLRDGQLISVDGFSGKVIEGKGEVIKTEIKEIVPTRDTQIELIVDVPEYAEKAATSKAKSVGLVRLDMFSARTGKHPVWYIKNNKIEEYSKMIYENLKEIARSFEEVNVRTSDVKSDEYRNLEGSPDSYENNPLMGDRGIRYGLKNQELIESELKAVKDLGDEFDNKKFNIYVSHLVSVRELRTVKRIFKEVVMPKNVKLGIMIETPAAVQIINDLCDEGIRSVNIGLESLAQFTLAADMNNPNTKMIYDEMNPAVLNSVSYVIRRCKRYGVKTSLVWSNNAKMELLKFLSENKIDSICVQPDLAYDVSKQLVYYEENMKNQDKSEEIQERNEKLSDEDVVLKALENGTEDKNITAEKIDEYNPSLREKPRDIPSLNDAIPVDSDFVDIPEEIDEPGEVSKESEPSETFFENQEDQEFEKEVEEEVQESEVREQMKKQILGGGEQKQEGEKEEEEDGLGKGDDEVLNIF